MSEPMVWYVGFTDESATRRWHWFTKEGFRHCYCFAQAPSGVIVVNYTGAMTEIKFAQGWNAEDFAFGLAREGQRILEVSSKTGGANKIRGLTYCVSSVKSCINVGHPFLLTPQSLFKWLKKQEYVLDFNEILEKVKDGK